MYPDVQLYIDGSGRAAEDGRTTRQQESPGVASLIPVSLTLTTRWTLQSAALRSGVTSPPMSGTKSCRKQPTCYVNA